MANDTIGTVFTKVKSGEDWTVISSDGVKVVLEKGEDQTTIAFSSLKDKRQWVKKEEPAVDDDAEQVSDPTPASKKHRESKPMVGVGKDIRDYIVEKAGSMNGIVLTDSGRFTSLKINNKMFAAIFSYSKKSLTLGVRSAAVEDKEFQPTSKANHMMDYRFKMSTLDDSVKKMIDILLEASATYQLNKNNKSKEVH